MLHFCRLAVLYCRLTILLACGIIHLSQAVTSFRRNTAGTSKNRTEYRKLWEIGQVYCTALITFFVCGGVNKWQILRLFLKDPHFFPYMQRLLCIFFRRKRCGCCEIKNVFPDFTAGGNSLSIFPCWKAGSMTRTARSTQRSGGEEE